MPHTNETREPDEARLAQAATDMYQALKSVMQVTGGAQHWNGATHVALRQVEAALAQVEGTAPAPQMPTDITPHNGVVGTLGEFRVVTGPLPDSTPMRVVAGGGAAAIQQFAIDNIFTQTEDEIRRLILYVGEELE